MTIEIKSAALVGINGYIINVEVHIAKGLPSFNIVGMPNIAVKEARERVRAAIINCGYKFPLGRIVVNLAPADIKKEGALLDLPIAIGILMASEQINSSEIQDFLFVGELSLRGDIKPVRGVIPILIEAKKQKINHFIIPLENLPHCEVLENYNLYPFSNLKEVTLFIDNRDLLPFTYKIKNDPEKIQYSLDYLDINGQEAAKRALEISAAGGHNILLYGPPGSGKTMLASRFPTILPLLSYEEALEVNKIYSVSGILSRRNFFYERPFRSPHHSSTKAALVGGGNELRVGEITLAHNGVLFLDEILEFKKDTLEVLRQPLEEKCINLSKGSGSISYPANFILIAALNPCPCGNAMTNHFNKPCTCTYNEKDKYLKKLSGALLDRMDMFISVPLLSLEEIKHKKVKDNSKDIRRRVEKAREIQQKRFQGSRIKSNAQMTKASIDKFCVLNSKSLSILETIYEKYNLSMRAYYKIIMIARTIADLNDNLEISERDIIEAINYRKYINKEIL